MAVDPKDLRLLNHGRAPNAAPTAIFPAPPPFSPRKVKFLCSFGGQIIPRPSDGLLRYAGGETRILTFRRDATLAEIMSKMSEILGQTAALRYQLPDVDLDALVSVSNPEDLENMMEEYDKLADSAPDGSAKLRVFLFTPSDAAAASDPSSKPKMDDTAQRYLDAVNGFSSDGSLRRKDSLASVSSTTHNSDGGQIVNDAAAVAAPASADGGNEGTSSTIPSPAGANFDQSRIMFAGTQILNTASAIPIHNVANPDQSGLLFAVAPSPDQALCPPHPEFPPATHYADQNQAQYANLQPVPNNVASFSARSYIPPAVHVAPHPPGDSHMEENTYSGRAAQVHNDPNYKPVYPLLSQLPPLPPTYLQLHNGEWYGLHPAGSPRSQIRVLRMMDCYMCQKGLMHAHSDTVLQENGNGTGSTVSEASGGVPVLQSVHSEDVSRSRAPNQLINKLMAERVVESKPENMMPASQFSSYVVPQKPETQHENGRTVVPKAEISDNAVASRPPATMVLPSASQMSNGLFVNIPPTQYEDSQQQQLPEYVGQPHILVRPDFFTTPYGNGVYPVRNVNGYPVEHLSRGSMLESSYGYGRSINGMMESLRVTPYENSGYHENRRPILTSSDIGAVKELKPENPPSVQNCYPVRQQVGGGDAAFVGNTFANPGIIPEGNYVRPADQLLPSSAGLTQLQNFQSVIPSQALLLNPEIASEPMASNGRLHGNPTFSCGFDPAHNNTINNISIGDWKDETSQQLKDMTTELGGTPSVTVSIPPSSSGTNGHVKLVQEHVPSDPPLYNQDPMKILASTSMRPPLPHKVASKESVIPKDMSTENLLISTNSPDVAVVIDQPPNSVIKESCLEHPVRATRGSGDEHIKQELQALAEGVASSVLQSSVTSAPTFVTREMKDPTTQPNKEWGFVEGVPFGIKPRMEYLRRSRISSKPYLQIHH